MTQLSVIVPCYNESTTILHLIEKVRLSPIYSKEIIIVDDGSVDGTRELLQSLEEKASDLKILFHSKNMGKGAALRTGFAAAAGEICIVQDADLEYDPQEFPLVIQPIIDGKADVVFGSRLDSDYSATKQGRQLLHSKTGKTVQPGGVSILGIPFTRN